MRQVRSNPTERDLIMEKLDWFGLAVSPYDDMINGRKILERIEEIESEHMDEEGEVHGIGIWSKDDRDEWTTLTGLVAEIGEQHCRNGVILIRENHLRDHIKEEYDEIGGELYEYNSRYPGRGEPQYRHVPWDELMNRPPFSCIDWDRVASECESDYSIVEFEGTTYYYEEP